MEDLENTEDVEENMRCKYLHQIKNYSVHFGVKMFTSMKVFFQRSLVLITKIQGQNIVRQNSTLHLIWKMFCKRDLKVQDYKKTESQGNQRRELEKLRIGPGM